MKSLIERAINLAKVTKGNVIIADEENNEGYVVMDLAEYERLVFKKGVKKAKKSLTEEELVDKINRDIAYSQKREENEVLKDEIVLDKLEELSDFGCSFSADDKFDEENEEEDEEDEEESMYYYSENEKNIKDNTFSFKTEFINDDEDGNGWKIPSEIKKKAEETE